MANDRGRWTVRRELLPTPGAWQRWDRAYQLLLAWTSATDQREERQEEGHEGGVLRAGLDGVPGAGPDD
jgi:hypothetical protein